MFVSRGALESQDGRRGQSVLIEIQEGCEVDKGVVPSVIEFVLRDITSRGAGEEGGKCNIALTCIDRSPRDFQKIARKSSISAECVIDGFSEWYGTRESNGGESVSRGPGFRKVHIGTADPCSAQQGSMTEEILGVWNASVNRTSTQRIAIIDSLSSLFRFWPGIDSFLDLRDKLYAAANEGHIGCSVIFIGVIRQTTRDTSLLISLRRSFETLVTVKQGEMFVGHTTVRAVSTNSTSRDLVTLKVCKRKLSGRVQLEEVVARIDPATGFLQQVEVKNDNLKNVPASSREEEEEQRQEKALSQLGLSFRVSLSTKEKEVRAAAGLPYLHQDEGLADSGLQLHPDSLQVGRGGAYLDASPASEDSDTDSDEEMFSEDV
ncbi:unnamed protein product [Chondrus crispus]|uniref:Elongator complex protein 5 n=1 Tax=Chondrus crispus TaxID=2769 RepID=R7Q838_CHOCR|nr:unnamed protein product [Chondrus crispus]CDF33521.1 unnamed protein product [Chondrus crispus]|eukprot:XP_005713324.1 unnamed protein product [Chondrus crispus]